MKNRSLIVFAILSMVTVAALLVAYDQYYRKNKAIEYAVKIQEYAVEQENLGKEYAVKFYEAEQKLKDCK